MAIYREISDEKSISAEYLEYLSKVGMERVSSCDLNIRNCIRSITVEL